jgi:membrane-bound lytic murein transglycosylase B
MKPKHSDEESKLTSRRRFTQAVAATIACAPLAATLSQAQTPATSRQAPALPNPQPTPATPAPSAIAEAYAEVARARFGQQVTPEQFEQIKKDLDGNVRVAERLRAVKLKNGDEPDFVFNAD